MGGSFNWMLHILKCINYFLFCFWQKCFSLIFDVLTLLIFLINWPIKIEQKVKEKMVEAKVWFANAYFIFSIKKSCNNNTNLPPHHYFGTHVYGGDELELWLDGVQYYH